jgi:DNA-binding beta-propeller fold protein YncE
MADRQRICSCLRLSVVLLVFGLTSPVLAGSERAPIDLVFVAGRASGEIAMIDSQDDRVVDRIMLDRVPDQFVLSEARRLLVAAHVDAQTLSLFDLETMKPRADVALGFPPDEIQLDDKSGMVAVAGRADGKLALIALDTATIVGRIEGLAHPSDLIFDKTGERLLVASGSHAWIDVVDVGSTRLAGRIELDADGSGVRDLVRTPGGRSGLALHGDSGLISGLDLIAARQVERTWLPGPADRAFPSANSQFFLVPNGSDQSVSTISSWTYRDYERIATDADVSGISFGMFDTIAIALDADANQAMAFSLIDERPPVTAIDLPGRPETSLAVEAGTKLYVALGDTNQIAVLDMTQPRLMGTIDDVVEQPWAVNAAGALGYCH